MVTDTLALIAAAVLVAAGVAEAELHVEHVDDSGHPDVSIVVSAPQLEATDPGGAFRVLDDGTAVPVEVSAVPPEAVEVAVLAATPAGPDGALPPVRSAVMDIMLRLPPGTSVSLVAATDPPEVVAEPGTSLQARMVAANRLAPDSGPALGEALELALEQFSGGQGTVRSVIVVGDGEVPDGLAGRLAERQVRVHTVQPDRAAGDTDRLGARLSNLYRLSFEVAADTGEVEVQLVADGPPVATSVVLRAAAEAAPPPERPADVDRGPLAADGLGWRPLLFVMIAMAAVLLLSAAIALPKVAAGLRDTTSGASPWGRTAGRVAGETSAGDAVGEAAARIARERGQAAAQMRAAGLEARLAAAVLAVQPLVAGALVVVAGRRVEDLTTGAWRPAALLVALVLAVAGAVWLRRVTRPPFSASPARWQAHDREATALRDVAETLDVANLYAAGGLSLDESLARAGAADPEHPARRRAEAGDAGDASSAEILVAASTGIRSEQVSAAHRYAESVPAAIAVPFVACTLPATILIAVAGWPALAGG